MSIPAFGWALQQGAAHNLKPSDRLLLLFLADQAGPTGETSPGQPKIRKFTGLAIRTIREGLETLVSKQLVEAVSAPGRHTAYRLLRPLARQEQPMPPRQNSTRLNGGNRKGVPYTPANQHPVTPANEHGVQRSDPGKSYPLPGADLPVTPANEHPHPLSIQESNPKTREDARKEGVGFSSGLKEASQPEPAQPEPEREPTPAEIEARRREHAAAMAELPEEMAAAIGGLGAALSGRAYEPGRPPLRSPADQEAALEARRPRPAYVTGDALLMLRRLAGIPSPPPALRRAAE